MIKKSYLLIVAFAIMAACATIAILKLEQAKQQEDKAILDLKLEIGSLRYAMDEAIAVANERKGKMQISPGANDSTWILVTFDDYPSKEFIVKPGGEGHAITLYDDGSLISDHVATWGRFEKWHRE